MPIDRTPAECLEPAPDHPRRRLFIRSAALLLTAPLLSASIGQAQADKTEPRLQLRKRSKASVHYQDQPNQGRSCAKCMLYAGNGRCAILEETVSPYGWCNQWVPPTMG